MKRILLCVAIIIVSVIALMSTQAHADVGRGDRGGEVTEVQVALRSFGYSVAIDGRFGVQTERAVRHFQAVSGLEVDGVVGRLTEGALALQPAARLNPPPPPVLWTTDSSGGRCVGMIAALEHWSPGWDVNRMAGILYRESRCDPNAANSCCTGVGQVHAIWIPKAAMCGVFSRADLKDPWKNICTMAIVYREQGIGAWDTA